MGLLFAKAAALFGAAGISGEETGAGVKPGGQGGVFLQAGGFASEIGEDCLRNILCGCGIAVDLPERGGIDQIDVLLDELGKGLLRSMLEVALKKFVAHLTSITTAEGQDRTFCARRPTRLLSKCADRGFSNYSVAPFFFFPVFFFSSAGGRYSVGQLRRSKLWSSETFVE